MLADGKVGAGPLMADADRYVPQEILLLDESLYEILFGVPDDKIDHRRLQGRFRTQEVIAKMPLD
jgi:hypothetical protein